MKQIILASASPRRRDLLESGGITFTVRISSCDEQIPRMAPSAYVRTLSERKCLSVAAGASNAIVIGADTIVYYKGAILGKPADEEEAFAMLQALSGNTHSVYTGVTLFDTETKKKCSFYEKTEVTFYPVTGEEIRRYIRTGEPMDKAGAYGIQGKGVFLVRKINGDYNTVVGLPLARLLRVLPEFEKESI